MRKTCEECGYFALIEKNNRRIGYCVKNDEEIDYFAEMCKQMKKLAIFDWLSAKKLSEIDQDKFESEDAYIRKCVNVYLKIQKVYK